jgi:hypothetical protein
VKVVDATPEAERVRKLAFAQCDAHEIGCVLAKEMQLPYEDGLELANRYVDDGTILVEAEAGRATIKEKLVELAINGLWSKNGPQALAVLAQNYLGFVPGGLAKHLQTAVRAQQKVRTRATSKLAKGAAP